MIGQFTCSDAPCPETVYLGIPVAERHQHLGAHCVIQEAGLDRWAALLLGEKACKVAGHGSGERWAPLPHVPLWHFKLAPQLSLSCSSDYTELSLSPLVWHLPSKYHGEGGPGSGSLTPELAANGEEKSTFKSLMSHKYMGKYFCRPGRMRKQEEGKWKRTRFGVGLMLKGARVYVQGIICVMNVISLPHLSTTSDMCEDQGKSLSLRMLPCR